MVIKTGVALRQTWQNGARDGGRTHNLQLRRLTLYPIELRAQCRHNNGAGTFAQINFATWNASAGNGLRRQTSVFRRARRSGHLHELRIELAEDFDQIGLRGHDGVDVLIDTRHFIEAGGEQLDAALGEQLLTSRSR